MKPLSFLTAISLCLWTASADAMGYLPDTATDVTAGTGVAGFTAESWYDYTSFYDMLQAAGVKIIRVDFGWEAIEQSQGEYTWAAFDHLVDQCAQHDIRVMNILCYGNSLYGDGYQPSQPGYYGTQSFRDGYSNFAAATVRHYSTAEFVGDYYNYNDVSKRPIWEIWNEPNGFWPGSDPNQYMALANQAIPRMRSSEFGDPNATIIAAATALLEDIPPDNNQGTEHYLGTCFDQGLLAPDMIDALSVHMYRGGTPESVIDDSIVPSGFAYPETLATYDKVRDLMDGHDNSQNVKIVCSEWGYPVGGGVRISYNPDVFTAITAQSQADYLARMMLSNARYQDAGQTGVPTSICYTWRDTPAAQVPPGADPNDPYYHYGLIDENFNPKPAYYALKTFNNTLAGFHLTQQYPGATENYLVFLGANGYQGEIVGWTADNSTMYHNDAYWGTFMINGTPLYLGQLLTWGGGNGNWSTSNWDSPWTEGYQAQFHDAGNTITIGTASTVSGLQFNANNVTITGGKLRFTSGGGNLFVGSNYTATINSEIADAVDRQPGDALWTYTNTPATFSLRKCGTGTAIFSQQNTAHGGLMIGQGKVQLNHANAAQNLIATLLCDNGLTFGTGIGTFDVGGLSGSGNLSLTNTNGGAIALSVGGANDLTTYSGQLSGSGSLVKVGTGDLVLSGVNAYSGSTTIQGGSIVMGKAQAFGTTSPIKLDGGSLSMNGYNLSGHTLEVTANGGAISNWNQGSTSVLTPTSVSILSDVAVIGSGNLELSGAFVSSGSQFRALGKYGTGTLTLSGATGTDNAYLNLAANEGTVVLNKTATVDNVHAAANLAIQPGAIVQYAGNTIGGYSYQVWQGGSIVLNGGTIDFNGRQQSGTSMIINTTGSKIANSGGGVAYVPTSFAVAPGVNWFQIDTPTTIDVQTAIICNRGTGPAPWLQKTGIGALMLGGNVDNLDLALDVQQGSVVLNKTSWNTVHCATALSVNAGATVYYGGSGDYQLAQSNCAVTLAGTIDFNGHNQIGTDFTANATSATLANSAAGTNSYYAPYTFTYQTDFTVDTTGNLEIDGAVVGNASWPHLVKIGGGTLKLSGTTDNTGLTLDVWGGTVELNKQNTQPGGVHAATAVVINPQGTVRYTGTGDYQIANGSWLWLNGGVLDLNGKNQSNISLSVNTAGSTLANTFVGTTSTIDSTSGVALYANLTVNAVGDLKIDTAVSDTGMLTKTGTGMLFLTKANTYSGGTTVKRGTLVADFTATDAPTADILKSTAALTLAGGTLHTQFYIPGNSQTVSSTTIASGASGVLADTAGGTVNLNAITRNTAGGTVHFTPNQGANIRTSTANCVRSGGQQTILGGYATYDTYTWAVSGTTGGPWSITGLQNYTNSRTFTANKDMDSPTNPYAIASNLTINSLRFNNSGATTLNINSGKTLTVATGGILMTPNAGAVAISSTGSLTTGNGSSDGSDLIVHQNSLTNTMTINANIMGTGKGLTKSGLGRLVLSGNKTYTGVTTVNEGTLALSSGTLSGTSGITLNAGGTLLQNSSTALNKSITFNGGTLGGTARYTYSTASGTLTIGNGSHLSPGDPIVPGTYGLGVGTLEINGSTSGSTPWALNLDSSSVLDFTFGTSSNTCDKILMSGGTNRHLILDGTMFINWANSLIGGNGYIIFSGFSSYVDNGLVFGNVPTGHSYNYIIDNTAHTVVVTVAPEPGTIVILATALLSFLAYVWRKRG